MKACVTGAAGFVGSVLCRRLVTSGVEVAAVDNLSYGGHGLLGLAGRPGFSFYRCKGPAVPEAAAHGADLFVHLAALVGYPACHADPALARAINVDGTRAVMQTAAGRPILFASTADLYAPRQDRAVVERDDCRPASEYAATKFEAESLLLHEYPAGVALRFVTGCGVSSHLRLDLLFNDCCLRARRDRYLLVYERGFLRNFVHVEDMAEAIALAVARWPDLRARPWNVAGHESMVLTKGELAEAIGRRTGARIYYAGEGAGEDVDRRNYRVDGSAFRAATGYAPGWTLDAALDQMIAASELLEAPDGRRRTG